MTLHSIDGGSRISIHAPREGSDPIEAGACHRKIGDFYPRSPRGERLDVPPGVRRPLRISIHAPREGSDLRSDDLRPTGGPFLSTLPARGATSCAGRRYGPRGYFYPRSPRGERLQLVALDACHAHISIHAPREGSDHGAAAAVQQDRQFLSTLPARGATRPPTRHRLSAGRISIHAPREGSDGVAVCISFR